LEFIRKRIAQNLIKKKLLEKSTSKLDWLVEKC
jgi:hypothetical protein